MPCSQFYFIFPFLVVLAYGQRVSRASPHVPLWRWAPYTLLALCFGVSLALSAAFSFGSMRLAFYVLPSRFWQLMLGALLFEWQSTSELCRSRGGRTRKLVVTALEVVVVAAALVAFTTTRIDVAFPFPGSIPAIAAAALFIAPVSYTHLTLPTKA